MCSAARVATPSSQGITAVRDATIIPPVFDHLPASSHPTIQSLRDGLDRLVVGQEQAKNGLILGLIARRHVYLEGPPGCGKSLLAEGFSHLCGGRVTAISFHRDTRPEDVLGDVLLRRSKVAVSSGAGDGNGHLGKGDPEKATPAERIRVDIEPGPLFESDVLLLEDLTRAPGEALGVLLRLLGERRALGRDLPLEMAIATAPIEASESHADPLEPTQLDRFGVQIAMTGLLGGRYWSDVAELARRTIEDSGAMSPEPARLVMSAAERHRLQHEASELEVPKAVRRAYEELLDELRVSAPRSDESLLSDRSMASTALSLFRAHALVRGAERVGLEDLAALRYMVAKRLSEELQKKLDELIDSVDEDETSDLEVPATGGESEGSRVVFLEGGVEQNAQAASKSTAPLTSIPDEVESDPERMAAQVEPLMRALAGRIERGWVDPESDPGGQPRSYRPMRRLDEILDADLIDAMLLVEGSLPGGARTFRRKRKSAGGALVVLRDISASMAGPKSAWAAQIVRGVIRASGRHRIRVGYVEFDHRARAYPVGGRFLHRSYGMLIGLAESQRAIGQTNYEAPLRVALDELRGRIGRNRHIVMLTDGLPILGDPRVRRERRLAHRLGVRLHTIFLGDGDCPDVLDDLSHETDGLRFRCRSEGENDLRLEQRA